MALPDDVDSILQQWIAQRNDDPHFDPLADLDPAHPHHDELVRRWRVLDELGLLGTQPSVWSLPPKVIPRDWPRPARPENKLREYGGRYLCTASIGSGGMGEVFRAVDVELDREVAVKVLKFAVADSRRIRGFLDEARRNAGMEHPSIVPLYDVGSETSREIYFVMKLVEGSTLGSSIVDAKRSPRPPFEPRQLVRILRSLAEALAFTHDNGLIHRDLKPSNVMIGRHGEVQLMDWGVAAPYLTDVRSEWSQRGDGVSGTPAYMAPEQARGEAGAEGPWTDLFGLGALLFALLSGGPPYRGGDHEEVLERAREARRSEPVRADWLRAAPRELVAIANKAMAPRPEDRYASADDFIDDLDAYTERRAGSAWRNHPLERVQKTVARHPVATVALLLGFVAVGLGFGFMQSSQRAAFEQSVNDRTAWMETAQTILDQPREGLSAETRYDEAARRIQRVLSEAELDVTDPKRAAERVETLRVEDPQRAETTIGLLHDLGLALIWSGAAGPPSEFPPDASTEIGKVHAMTRREDPRLFELWEPYKQLRSSIERGAWSQQLWEITLALATDGPSKTYGRLLELSEGLDEARPIEARGFTRLALIMSDRRLTHEVRQARNLYPGSSTIHETMQRFIYGNTDDSKRAGTIDAVEVYGGFSLAAESALAAWTAVPQSIDLGATFAHRRFDQARAAYSLADEMHDLIVGVESGEFDQIDVILEKLRAFKSSYRNAGFAHQQEGVDLAQRLFEQDPNNDYVLELGVVCFADAVNDLRKWRSEATERVRARWDKSGYSEARLVEATMHMIDSAEEVMSRRPDIYLDAAESLAILLFHDRALELVDEAIATFPDEATFTGLRERILQDRAFVQKQRQERRRAEEDREEEAAGK
ncbi:MAG: serine/threonine-protein kinase [Planctomycetota bacterium]